MPSPSSAGYPLYIRRCGRVYVVIECQGCCPKLKRLRRSLLAKTRNKICLLNKKLNVLAASTLWHYVLNLIDSATFARNVAFRCIWVTECFNEYIRPKETSPLSSCWMLRKIYSIARNVAFRCIWVIECFNEYIRPKETSPLSSCWMLLKIYSH